MEILSSPRRSLLYLFKTQALVSEHCCLPTTVSHSLVTPLPLFLSQAILGAGHYVYADQPEEFNQKVKEICHLVDWAHGAVGALWLTPLLSNTLHPRESRSTTQEPGRPPVDSALLSYGVTSTFQPMSAFSKDGFPFSYTTKSSNLIVALNKGYLSFWCTEKLWFFSWDFSFLPNFAN